MAIDPEDYARRFVERITGAPSRKSAFLELRDRTQTALDSSALAAVLTAMSREAQRRFGTGTHIGWDITEIDETDRVVLGTITASRPGAPGFIEPFEIREGRIVLPEMDLDPDAPTSFALDDAAPADYLSGKLGDYFAD